MNKEARQAVIDYRMEEAGQALVETEVLLQRDLYRGAINRAYYAMFYAVQALFVQRGLKAAKHGGAIALFDREFVHTGSFAPDCSKWLHYNFKIRLDVDYGDMSCPNREMSDEALTAAREFVARVRLYLANPVPEKENSSQTDTP